MGRLREWILDLLPDSRLMCAGYAVGAVFCVAKGMRTIGSEKLYLGRNARVPTAEGTPAVVIGYLFMLIAALLLLYCVRYLREMKGQYKGLD